jgi:hypothetical protein
MAGKPKENQQVHCHCPLCQGALVDPVKKMQHTGQVSSSRSWMAEDLAVLREMWGRGERLADYVKQLEG